MTKCDMCQKAIIKRNPGLECNRCEKIVHLIDCSGLTTKQRNALKAADNLEWTCKECQENSPKRRSVIIPKDDEEDDDEDTNTYGKMKGLEINVKQLLKDISKELEKTMHKELAEMTKAIEYQNDKMDEVTDSIESFKTVIQDLKRKNQELQNKNNNLETRVGALEQRLQEFDQGLLSKTIEVANVPYQEEIPSEKIMDKLTAKLQVLRSDIESIKILPLKKDKPATIQVTLKNDTMPARWLAAAKTTKITASDLVENINKEEARKSIYVREALTYYKKKLLWNTKQKLQDSFKYVWCKGGVIRARKDEKENVITIRTEEDLLKIGNNKRN